jgi:hypothetical protein
MAKRVMEKGCCVDATQADSRFSKWRGAFALAFFSDSAYQSDLPWRSIDHET